MKFHRSLFYGCLVIISIVYLLTLNYVRTDSLYIFILFITHFIFTINYMSYSINDMKECVIQSLTLIFLMIIPLLFHSDPGWYDYLVMSLYLSDLAMILGKLIDSKIKASSGIRKSIFFFIPLIATFIIPLCFIELEYKIVNIDGMVLRLSKEPPITLLFIFLLSLYLSMIIFLSNKNSSTNLALAIFYILILAILFFINIFPPYIYISIQLINSLTILISYTILSFREKIKFNSNNYKAE